MTSRSPCFTKAPSRKCAFKIAPPTRGRISTRSMASKRPENSSQLLMARCSAAATETGTAGGGADTSVAASAFRCGIPKRMAPPPAADNRILRPAPHRARRAMFDVMLYLLTGGGRLHIERQAKGWETVRADVMLRFALHLLAGRNPKTDRSVSFPAASSPCA